MATKKHGGEETPKSNLNYSEFEKSIRREVSKYHEDRVNEELKKYLKNVKGKPIIATTFGGCFSVTEDNYDIMITRLDLLARKHILTILKSQQDFDAKYSKS